MKSKDPNAMPAVRNGSMAASPPRPRRSEPVGRRISKPAATCPGTLLELVQEELVLERQIADAAHRSLIARVGEHQRNLQTHTPSRQNGNLEGTTHFGDPARRAFFVIDSKLEFAVEEGSTRHEWIDELAVDVVRPLGPHDRRGEPCRDEYDEDDDASSPHSNESTKGTRIPGQKRRDSSQAKPPSTRKRGRQYGG